MASISEFGIACARLMAVLAASSLSAAAPAQPRPQPAMIDLTIEIDGLRDANGVVRICLTANARDFPDCKAHDAVSAVVKASQLPIRYTFKSIPTGVYAVGALHDANDNGKLDTMMGIPREGFAFSRNPAIKPRAPHFDETSFRTNGSPLPTLKMKYLL